MKGVEGGGGERRMSPSVHSVFRTCGPQFESLNRKNSVFHVRVNKARGIVILSTEPKKNVRSASADVEVVMDSNLDSDVDMDVE